MEEWPVWRLVVVEKIATLEEVNTKWSLEDIVKANALLDMKQHVEACEAERITTK